MMVGISVHTAAPINSETAFGTLTAQAPTGTAQISGGAQNLPNASTDTAGGQQWSSPGHEGQQISQNAFSEPTKPTTASYPTDVDEKPARLLSASAISQPPDSSVSVRSQTQPSSWTSAITPSEPHDLSHPPGYRQQQASFSDRPVENDDTTSSLPSLLLSKVGGARISNTEAATTALHEEGAVWDNAVSWAKAAGEKLGETEAQVWKMLNRQS